MARGSRFATDDGACPRRSHRRMCGRGLIEIDFARGTAAARGASAARDPGWARFQRDSGGRVLDPDDRR